MQSKRVNKYILAMKGTGPMTGEIPPYIENLISVASKIRAEKNLPESSDPTEGAILVACDMVARVVPWESFYKASGSTEISTNVGAFVALIVSSIVIGAKKHAYLLPNDEVLASTFFSLYQMHNRETALRLVSEGVNHYKSIMVSAIVPGEIQDLVSNLAGIVERYVAAEQEGLMEGFEALYDAIKGVNKGAQ